ncbi:MAG: precorrin-3B C(17)-methyltransferase [Methanolinea sp.]|nr:precorrin-3B C(17)-methyltransferase [Methanolinea sp.]
MPLPDEKQGILYVVGTGPGNPDQMTGQARRAIMDAEYILGNESYLAPISHLIEGKKVVRSSMGKEVERAKEAVSLARDHVVAMISGGDPGVYGMAGIVLEVAEHAGSTARIEVIPGVTAATAAASRLGSPLSGDFAIVSLSDLLTPIEVIEERLSHAFAMGIPVVLYNPRSRGRPHNFARAMEIASLYRDPETPLGLVKNAFREGEVVKVTTLREVAAWEDEVDMHSAVIVGGKESRIWKVGEDVRGIITPRGYHRKYVY